MKKLSSFDIGMIVTFVIVTLLGGGAWWYLSGQLQAAQQDVAAAKADLDKYTDKEPYLPNAGNEKILQDDVALIKAQLDPLIQQKLLASGNKLSSITTKDTVTWKHELDDEVANLNNAAKTHNVGVPNNFYFSFSRYLNVAPSEDKTAVLSKQLLAIKEISTILINAPVKNIMDIQRTFEEDAGGGGNSNPGGGARGNTNTLGGFATQAPGGIYTVYPFTVEFETTTGTDGFRKILNDLIQSPYVFVVRTITVQNSKPTSPAISDLNKMAGPAPGMGTESSPGATAAPSIKGPQYLFGGETLHIKAQIDLIEWNAQPEETAPTPNRPRNRASTPAPTSQGN